jgi:hypothetical protein
MDQRPITIWASMIAVSCLTAPIAAAMLGYIAHYDFGLSRQEIRTPALVGAIIISVVIATLMTIEFSPKGCASHDRFQTLRGFQTVMTGVGLEVTVRGVAVVMATVADAS